jgi:hypothetical protein
MFGAIARLSNIIHQKLTEFSRVPGRTFVIGLLGHVMSE